jgi:hypothetical protein
VSPVKYEQDFYIPEDGVLHSYCRETSNLTWFKKDSSRTQNLMKNVETNT